MYSVDAKIVPLKFLFTVLQFAFTPAEIQGSVSSHTTLRCEQRFLWKCKKYALNEKSVELVCGLENVRLSVLKGTRFKCKAKLTRKDGLTAKHSGFTETQKTDKFSFRRWTSQVQIQPMPSMSAVSCSVCGKQNLSRCSAWSKYCFPFLLNWSKSSTNLWLIINFYHTTVWPETSSRLNLAYIRYTATRFRLQSPHWLQACL